MMSSFTCQATSTYSQSTYLKQLKKISKKILNTYITDMHTNFQIYNSQQGYLQRHAITKLWVIQKVQSQALLMHF